MEIAVHFEKINLGQDRYIFKPTSVIRGKFNKEENTFETDYGVVCDSIDGEYDDSDDYFYMQTTVSELKKYFGSTLPEETLFTEYLNICFDNIYIGSYDFTKNRMNLKKIPAESIESSDLTDDSTLLESTEQKTKKEQLTTKTNISKEKSKYSLKQEESKKMTLKSLRSEVFSRIISQDDVVNDVTRTIMVNQTSQNPRHKSHILIAGPSGTGKTRIIDIIAKELNLPVFKADANAYSKEGYVGKSVYSMLEGLITAAGGNVELAQKGFLIIDEIDKKISQTRDDVSGQSVLYSLLKIMDRDLIELDVNDYMGKRTVMFDTSNLTIIFMGAFENIYKEKDKKKNKKVVGFGTQIPEEVISDTKITDEEFIKEGLPAEFLGRIGLVTFTNKLGVEDLVKILIESKDSPLKEDKEYFETHGIKITFSQDFIRKVAQQADKSNTGARKLRKIVTESLKCVYDDVLTGKKLNEINITSEILDNKVKYYSK